MKQWNIYVFQHGRSGLVRKLICRDLRASSEKAALDTVCKHLQGLVERGALFARAADGDDWCGPTERA